MTILSKESYINKSRHLCNDKNYMNKQYTLLELVCWVSIPYNCDDAPSDTFNVDRIVLCMDGDAEKK